MNSGKTLALKMFPCCLLCGVRASHTLWCRWVWFVLHVAFLFSALGPAVSFPITLGYLGPDRDYE